MSFTFFFFLPQLFLVCYCDTALLCGWQEPFGDNFKLLSSSFEFNFLFYLRLLSQRHSLASGALKFVTDSLLQERTGGGLRTSRSSKAWQWCKGFQASDSQDGTTCRPCSTRCRKEASGRFVMGRWGNRLKMLSSLFLLSLWPFSGITHFRKETLCYIRRSCLPAQIPADPLYTCA